MGSGYPYTVLVMPAHGGFRWRCGCGRDRWFADERECRDDGLSHQQSHPGNRPIGPDRDT